MAVIREGGEEAEVESGDNSTLDRDWQQKGAGNLCLVTSTGGGLCGRAYRGYKGWRHDFLSMPRQDPGPADIAAAATAILINEEPGLTIKR